MKIFRNDQGHKLAPELQFSLYLITIFIALVITLRLRSQIKHPGFSIKFINRQCFNERQVLQRQVRDTRQERNVLVQWYREAMRLPYI